MVVTAEAGATFGSWRYWVSFSIAGKTTVMGTLYRSAMANSSPSSRSFSGVGLPVARSQPR